MFGILTMHLARLINYGHSFDGAEDIYNLLVLFPLQYSEFHYFDPKRNLLTWPEASAAAKLASYYIVNYKREERIAVGQFHSGLSTPVILDVHQTEGLKMRPKKKKKKVIVASNAPIIADNNYGESMMKLFM